MTDREKAIVMAYTGYCMLAGDKLKVFYEYVGELLGRPVYTHEFADPDIRERASDDFYKLCRETTPEETITQKDWTDYWHKLSQSYAHTICVMAEAIAEHGEKQWIPCSERLPEDIKPVIVTWKNNNPPFYYQHIVGEHFTGVAHYKNDKWFWYSSVTEDVLAEYGRCDSEEIDGAIEVVAWMPLPQPWKREKEEGEPIPQWRGCMDGCLPYYDGKEVKDEQIH